MSRVVEFRPDARIEFDEAADWYEAQKNGLRREFVYAVNSTIIRIVSSPDMFPVVGGTFVRKALVNQFPYSIFFSATDQTILVYAVFHNSRNPLIWRGRIG